MNIPRRKCRTVKIGGLFIGGKNPIVIQSMTKTRTSDIENTVMQINRLEEAGCQVVRLAINDFNDAASLKQIKAKVKLALVADIHFNFRLAIAAIENGADKIRLNPGNIDKRREIEAVVSALKAAKIPLRIGLNSGSVKDAGSKKSSMSDKLVSACMRYVNSIT
jgi:(E)-4-hydroxy-3-methylbut-2-enyl-diphosphate synthase